MNKTRIFIFIIILLLVGVALVTIPILFNLQDFIYQQIVLPAAYLYWLWGLVYRSIPQVFIWALLLFFGLYFGFKYLGVSDKPDEELAAYYATQQKRERVGFWLLQVYRLGGDYDSGRFTELYYHLLIDALAFRERISPLQVEQQWESGQLTLPPEVEHLLKARRGIPQRRGRGLNFWLMGWIKKVTGLINRETSSQGTSSSTDHNLEVAVQYLEELCEAKT